ncbi:MAG: cysteine desulfurase [Chloroflexi bacterium]|nr:cysteine desulfurase [Chloroflexota bacterium]MCC6892111.1 cysteine desulfurase [Anaerolineae bacterium]
MNTAPASTQFDLEAIRADFPILSQIHHDDIPLVYLDNAATSQKPNRVIEATSIYYREYNANVHRGIHKLSEEATSAYENARLKVRKFINTSSKREVIFTRGTTEGINLVAQTWGRANLKAGDVVVSTVMEHHSNIVPWQILASEKGFRIVYVPVDQNGLLDLPFLENVLANEPVKLVTLMHVSNVLGTVNPIAEVVQKAHQAGALVLVDGAQSTPHMPIDVQALDVDFFVFSGHKMLGPTGSGVLYGRRAHLEAMPPWMGGGDMISSVKLSGSTWNDLPYKFEAGTPSIAEAIGLGYAIDYLSEVGMDKIHQHEQAITAYALEQLNAVEGIHIYGPSAEQKGAVAAFTVDGIHAHDIAQILDSEGVAVRAGHHCAMPLHEHLGVSATARASFYLYNRFDEVDRLVSALHKARKTFRL